MTSWVHVVISLCVILVSFNTVGAARVKDKHKDTKIASELHAAYEGDLLLPSSGLEVDTTKASDSEMAVWEKAMYSFTAECEGSMNLMCTPGNHQICSVYGVNGDDALIYWANPLTRAPTIYEKIPSDEFPQWLQSTSMMVAKLTPVIEEKFFCKGPALIYPAGKSIEEGIQIRPKGASVPGQENAQQDHLQILREAIAQQNRHGVINALANADRAGVTVEPGTRNMIMTWLGITEQEFHQQVQSLEPQLPATESPQTNVSQTMV